MEIDVRENRKLVEIWLTRAEGQDIAVREKLQTLCQGYRRQAYFVAVFESGENDLAGVTSDLLCYNRRRQAQAEARQGFRPC